METPFTASAHAPPAAVEPTRGAQREYLGLRLGAEQYAIDILGVQKIRGYEHPTRLADAPPLVLGVLDLRRVIGALVDAVSDVVELSHDDLLDAPEFSAQGDATCVTGIGHARTGERDTMLIVVDIERLMSTADIGLARSAQRH